MPETKTAPKPAPKTEAGKPDGKPAPKKGRIPKLEAFRLVRKVRTEGAKPGVRQAKFGFVKREDIEDGATYAIVGGTEGDPSVTFKDGEMMVGPFQDEAAAVAAVGDQVELVTGGVDPADDAPVSDEMIPGGEDALPVDVMEKRIQSNLLRLRRGTVERIRDRVRADILAESEKLDIDTDVKAGEESTDLAAGELDHMGAPIPPKVADPKDTGPNKLASVKSDSDPDADNSDDNLLECRRGHLVQVVETATGKQVDTGLVESSRKGIVKIEGGDKYDSKEFQFRRLAS
jgi:hypothetical protein